VQTRTAAAPARRAGTGIALGAAAAASLLWVPCVLCVEKRRAREIGVRLAVGSAPRAIVALILREGLGLAIGGVVLGVIGSFTLGRLVASQLYGIAPTNPSVMLLMMLALSIVATLACLVPARRAASVDVMKILSAP
jgi:putative ABC transport system permease protein